jgi:hypothetical protein
MSVHPILYPVFSLVAGILILIFPAILNYVVAIYLIIIGILGLVGGKVF